MDHEPRFMSNQAYLLEITAWNTGVYVLPRAGPTKGYGEVYYRQEGKDRRTCTGAGPFALS
jgi:hypothetical protein